MAVPVYLFTGFLDSGKSTFIQDTLRDPNFHNGEKTLLLLCEDGEVEYDETVMAAYGCDLVYVKKETDLSPAYLTELDQRYQPERVMIEFNGMWNVTAFLDVEYPLEWLLVQIMTTVDATSFAMYLNNMRSMVYDQLVHSELIIFNRCDASTKKSFLRSNIKAMNKGAQIIYESMDGSINQLPEDELPFDIRQKHLEIEEGDYGLWYMDVLERPQRYAGKTVSFDAQVLEVSLTHRDVCFVGREAMVCCAEDIQVIGFALHNVDCKTFKRGDWIHLQGEVRCEYDEEVGGTIPVIYAQHIAPAAPIHEPVNFS
ncbi:MAG: hypothetical protein HFE67_07795 [Erysipelotrichaceae bacterium]|nr:hypothetical protein [Erysipelotrichaceae bacterium]